MSLEVQRVVRKSFPVDVVKITKENISEVAEWCRGRLKDHDTPDGPSSHIEVLVHSYQRSHRERAYIDDWIVLKDKDFMIYGEKAYAASFETLSERVARESLFIPEIHARNTHILQLVKQAMSKADVAAYLGEGSSATEGVAEEITEKILNLFG